MDPPLKNRMTNPAEESWRVFVAIELPSHLRERIKDHIDDLRDEFPKVRASWIREENLHLTLKFLGDTPVNRVEKLSQAAERAARSVAPFEISIGGCGAFPPRGQPRVLWIGVKDLSGHLAALHQGLENECALSGFEREPRSFNPHLTIARVRAPAGSRELALAHAGSDFTPEAIKISALLVIRSELQPEGSRYTTVASHSLT